jgi:hypothetical protein
VVERISAFLSDNALTQSWAQTMDRHVITPLEQMGYGDDELRNRAAVRLAELNAQRPDGKERMLKVLEQVKGGPLNEGYVEKVNGAEFPVGMLRDQVYSVMADRETPRAEVSQLLEPYIDGRTGLSTDWDQMRQLGLGGPVAAYSAVTAGGAMATAAGLKAYDWWLAQQQQAEKDSQLPVQGGV